LLCFPFSTEIDALTDVMQDMRAKFAVYCNAVVHIGTTGLELADGIHKFNQKHRPGHLPSLSFAQVQYAFREQLRLKWARQFKEEAIYMFEHWYKQSEAQKNTVANYEIARQHCHHLKAQLMEHHEARAKVVEKNKPVPAALEKEILDAEQQFRKYSTALDSMRAAIVSNQQRLTGPQGQFVYFDKAFATLLEMQVALEREMRGVVDAYEPLIADARAEHGSLPILRAHTVGDGIEEDDPAAEAASTMSAFERQLKEMAEFVVQTHLEQDDMTGGGAASPQKRSQEVDALLSQFASSAPPTPSGGAGAGAPGSASGGLRLSMGGLAPPDSTGGGEHGGPVVGPSPRMLSARKKKRLSWGVNAGVSTVESPGATPLKPGSLATQAIAEEPEEEADAEDSGLASAGAARRLPGDPLMETDIDAYLEGQFDDAAAEDGFEGAVAVEGAHDAADSKTTGDDDAALGAPAGAGGQLAAPAALLRAASGASGLLTPETVEAPAAALERTAPWRDGTSLAAAAAGAGADAGAATGLDSGCGVDWPADLIVRDFELQSWEMRAGRRKPLRELLATLQLALWPGVHWKVVTIASMSGWAGVAAVLHRAWALVAPVAEAAAKELGSDAPAAALAALGETSTGVKYLAALRVATALAQALKVETDSQPALLSQQLP
jgi:hypothetical protein